MASGIDLQEFVAGFILEADEHIHSANRNLVSVSDALKAERLDPRAVRELFRSLHTIKGLASMVGAESIADISHEMEGLLRTADRSGGQVSEGALDLLVKGIRAIEERVKLLPKVGVAGLQKPPAKLIEDLIQIQSMDRGPQVALSQGELQLPEEVQRALSVSDKEQTLQGLAAKQNLILVNFEPSPERMAAGLNITSLRERIGKIAEIIKVTPHSASESPTGIAFYLLVLTNLQLPEVATLIGLPNSALNSVSLSNASDEVRSDNKTNDLERNGALESETFPIEIEGSSVRVDIQKLDEVLDRLSELIVTRSKLKTIVAKLSASGVDTRELTTVVGENERQLKRLRTAVTQARMVSFAELLQRLPLVVRGLTKDSDKSVDLFIQAGSAEVDKTVADKIFPAIVHLIRNSVDHAIETQDDRKAAGKDSTGVVTVHCDDSSGTMLAITIKDDGRGIDRDSVARKLDQPTAKTDDELLRQICTPGLSTRDKVSLTSGRGMGMDIVRKVVETLGGIMTLSTQPGMGTTFTLRVPVSITIVDVLSFISGGQKFVTPIAMVDEIIEINPESLPRLPTVKNQGPQTRLLQRRGETVPLFVLDSILKGQPDQTLPTRALVVNQFRGAVAFGIDRTLGQQEVVIRPLSDSLKRAKGLNGAADLGDGIPTLVLDLASLGAEYTTSESMER